MAAVSQKKRIAFIDEYPYQSCLDFRLVQRYPHLSAEQREQVFEALRTYFHLCLLADRHMVSMPSRVVDDVWHEFILFTRRYEEFCQKAFGKFLHHTPAEAMWRPIDASDGLKRAWRLACRREGMPPRYPTHLPLLFAIDSMLGIEGGYVYQLDSRRAGNPSAMGCGGGVGCVGDSAYRMSDSGDAGTDGGSDSSCGGGCGGGGGTELPR